MVEIDWMTFAGEYSEIYSALTMNRYAQSSREISISDYFRQLLYRGILKMKESIRN